MLKKSKEIKQALLDQLKKTPIVQIACEKLNITRMTFYRWKNEDKKFAAAIEESIIEGSLLVNDLAESQLIGAIKDRNMYAVMAWLKHHHPAYKTRVEIAGTVNTIHELSDEQKELVQRALALTDLVEQHHEKETSN